MGAHPKGAAAALAGAMPTLFPWTDAGINAALAAYQDQLPDWRLGPIDLAEVVGRLRAWVHDLWDTFIPGSWKGKEIVRPPILLKLEAERPRRLGHYCPGRNDLGMRWEISINPRHLDRETEVQLAATALHENTHCFEDLAGVAPRSRNGYHSALFRRLVEEWGIPSTPYGARLGIREDSPFMQWARDRGLSGDPMVVLEPDSESPELRRLPKRRSWTCSCPASERVQVLVARGTTLEARCERCRERFEAEGR